MRNRKKKSGPWPRLTETLTDHSIRCDTCQACGATWSKSNPIQRWTECDDDDRKENKHLSLCKSCADEIIEPHPRLYHQRENSEVIPGAMTICINCKIRDGNTCTIEDYNRIDFDPQPTSIHVCRSPRRLSGWKTYTPSPINGCSAKVPNDN